MNVEQIQVVTNTAAWDDFRARLPRELYLEMGVLAAQGGSNQVPGTNITLTDLATIHEFGTAARGSSPGVRGHAGIKERSFLRATFQRPDVLVRLNGIAARCLRGVADGRLTWEQALGQIGVWCVSQIQGTIRNRLTTGPDTQANAQSTILRKGSSTPLVDTGGLLGAITSRITRF